MKHEYREEILADYREHLGYLREAIDKVNFWMPDCLTVGKDKNGDIATVCRELSYDELYGLHKALGEMLDARKWLNEREREMKKAELPLEKI